MRDHDSTALALVGSALELGLADICRRGFLRPSTTTAIPGVGVVMAGGQRFREVPLGSRALTQAEGSLEGIAHTSTLSA